MPAHVSLLHSLWYFPAVTLLGEGGSKSQVASKQVLQPQANPMHMWGRPPESGFSPVFSLDMQS